MYRFVTLFLGDIRMLGWSHQLAMNEKCTDTMAEKSSLDMKTTIGPLPAEERST
jgi:hypothetical protein